MQLAFTFGTIPGVGTNATVEEVLPKNRSCTCGSGTTGFHTRQCAIVRTRLDPNRVLVSMPFPTGMLISPVGYLGPYGLGEDDIGGPPPSPETNLASFCFTKAFVTKKGKTGCWTTEHYWHHWNPISESERLGD